MPHDIAALLFALTTSLVTMATALPAVMGRVNAPARHAQRGVALQAAGWVLLLASGFVAPGGWADRGLSTLSMAALASGMAYLARAFKLWCGRADRDRMPMWLAVVIPLGYALAFPNYALRVGWANGLLALQMLLVAATLWRRPASPVGRWRWLLVGSLLAQLVVTAWRGVLGAFFTASYPTFLAPHPVNWAFAVVANVTSVLTLIGVLLAHRDEASRALERLATLDGLTAVLNRRAWLTQCETQLAVSVRYDRPLAVLMIDLDHFKQINDALGHEAGDRALQFVATALRHAVRAGDVVGRYGGEEFCVLMNQADAAATQAFDQRLREQLSLGAEQALGFAMSYSAGIAMRTGRHDTLPAMLARADALLYRAKAQGRDRTLDAQGMALAPWSRGRPAGAVTPPTTAPAVAGTSVD